MSPRRATGRCFWPCSPCSIRSTMAAAVQIRDVDGDQDAAEARRCRELVDLRFLSAHCLRRALMPEKSGFVDEGLKFEGGGGMGTIASACGLFRLPAGEHDQGAALPAELISTPSADDLRRFISPSSARLQLSGIQDHRPQQGKRRGAAAADRGRPSHLESALRRAGQWHRKACVKEAESD